jgi:hypothetical protein
MEDVVTCGCGDGVVRGCTGLYGGVRKGVGVGVGGVGEKNSTRQFY